MKKFKPGEVLICVKAETNFYTEGASYKVFKCSVTGKPYITADDGLKDDPNETISVFKRAVSKDTDKKEIIEKKKDSL